MNTQSQTPFHPSFSINYTNYIYYHNYIINSMILLFIAPQGTPGVVVTAMPGLGSTQLTTLSAAGIPTTQQLYGTRIRLDTNISQFLLLVYCISDLFSCEKVRHMSFAFNLLIDTNILYFFFKKKGTFTLRGLSKIKGCLVGMYHGNHCQKQENNLQISLDN